MRIISLIWGLMVIILFASALTRIGLNGFLEKSILDIQNNVMLSAGILLFSVILFVNTLFTNKKFEFGAGTVCGLGIATFLTGFETALGFSVVFYGISYMNYSNTHNKSNHSDAQKARADV